MIKTNDKYSENDGELFEYKVELILKKQYPEFNFIHTIYRQDGGKDFYTTTPKEKIWVEAKCYNRHLELSRIAGTFIMADICQINKIIVFSKSKLMEGAFINLSKYCSMHNKKLIVFNENDINNLIIKNGIVSIDEVKSINYVYHNIENVIELTQNELKSAINAKKTKREYDEAYSCLLMALTYKEYNEIACKSGVFMQDSDIQTFSGTFYLQSDFVQQEKLKTEIKAFDVFSAEFVLRNPSILEAKTVNIAFDINNEVCRMMGGNMTKVILEQGECIAVKYFFRAMNTIQSIPLPQPTISYGNMKTIYSMKVENKDSVGCRVIGETSYIGIDNQYLSQLNIFLSAPQRKFSTILLYGKSGVGKSRFLCELKNARMQKGNQCFLFGGDFQCTSIFEFFRQLLLSYYNFSFEDKSGDIILPSNINILTNSSDDNNTVDFIHKVLNNNSESFDLSLASKWLITFLKNNNITLLIDNVQNLNKDILAFINETICALQLCWSNSEIVLAFNTDMLLPNSEMNNFFNYYKSTISKDYKHNLVGFDKNNAVQYLRDSLDPKKTRNDISDFCSEIVNRIGTNPLFLKQIILYLFQKKFIGFINQTICFQSIDSISEALDCIPKNINDTIKFRFDLLLKSHKNQQDQIFDLFWSLLIFGKFPTHLQYCIEGIDSTTIKECIELGFINYGENNTLVFEHQLIAKSVLLTLQNDSYNENPVVNKIGLRTITATSYLDELMKKNYSMTRFIIEDYLNKVNINAYENFLLHSKFSEITNSLVSYVVRLVEKYNIVFHRQISPETIVFGTYGIIRACQDKLGVNKTYVMFSDIIKFQTDNYLENLQCVNEFIELLKYYLYEIPNIKKDEFINDFEKIGTDLLLKTKNYAALNDFKIWIKWAIGKNQMHMHDFKQAIKTLNSGKRLAKETKNSHRLAELYVQLGYLMGYLNKKEMTAKCWNAASEHFAIGNIYNNVIKLAMKGNAALINKDFKLAEQLCNKLSEIYYQKDCYAFLKMVINDFICNYLILKAVMIDSFDNNLDKQIKITLSRMRSVALTYKMDSYLRTAYKALTYYKYILSNFVQFRDEKDNAEDFEFVRIICLELLSNYNCEISEFTFFYPIFKDILEFVQHDSRLMQYIQNTAFLYDIYEELQYAETTTFLPIAKQGVLSDDEGKVNLYHFTYTW